MWLASRIARPQPICVIVSSLDCLRPRFLSWVCREAHVMTHLPHDLESSIQDAVQNGRFATVDDAMAKAARLPREISQGQPNAAGMGSIGAMPKAADELDEIMADAMTRRRKEPWRVNPAPGNGRPCVFYQARKMVHHAKRHRQLRALITASSRRVLSLSGWST